MSFCVCFFSRETLLCLCDIWELDWFFKMMQYSKRINMLAIVRQLEGYENLKILILQPKPTENVLIFLFSFLR